MFRSMPANLPLRPRIISDGVVSDELTQWIAPNGSLPDLTESYVNGAVLDIIWTGWNSSVRAENNVVPVCNLWVTSDNFGISKYEQMITTDTFDISGTGAFPWTINIDATNLSATPHFSLRFLSPGTNFNNPYVETPSIYSPAFEIRAPLAAPAVGTTSVVTQPTTVVVVSTATSSTTSASTLVNTSANSATKNSDNSSHKSSASSGLATSTTVSGSEATTSGSSEASGSGLAQSNTASFNPTALPTSTSSTTSTKSSQGLSTGSLAAIVVVSIIGGIILITLLVFAYRRHKGKGLANIRNFWLYGNKAELDGNYGGSKISSKGHFHEMHEDRLGEMSADDVSEFYVDKRCEMSAGKVARVGELEGNGRWEMSGRYSMVEMDSFQTHVFQQPAEMDGHHL